MLLRSQAIVLPCSAARNEIGTYRIVFVQELNRVLRRNPIRKPGVNGPAVSAHRIANQIPVHCVSIPILKIPVVKDSMIALVIKESGLFRRYPLDMEIKFRNSRNSGDVETWMPGIPGGILNGRNRIFRVSIAIKDNVVSHFRDIKRPVHLGLIVSGHRKCAWIVNTNKTTNKIRPGEGVGAADSAEHASASKSELQESERFNIEFLSVHERSRNVWMTFETAKEHVDPNRSQMLEKARQTKWLGVHEPSHIHGLDIVI